MLEQQLFNALVLGSIYALFALGFTLTFGVLRVINLMYGFYFTIGAFLALLGVQALHLPLFLACIGAVVGSGIIGVVLDGLLLTPLRRARAPELSSLIVTLGGVLLMNNLMTIVFGVDVRRFPAGLLGQRVLTLGPVDLGWTQIIIVLATFVMVAAIFFLLEKTRAGLAIRALAGNPDAASLMGVNVGRIVMLVSFVSALFTGIAGVLIGLNFNAVDPYMGESIILRGFVVVIIGGLGNIRGALIAGLGLGLVEVMTAGYVSSSLKEAVGFSALVVTLWLRPQGLFGRPSGKRA